MVSNTHFKPFSLGFESKSLGNVFFYPAKDFLYLKEKRKALEAIVSRAFFMPYLLLMTYHLRLINTTFAASKKEII